MSGFGPKIFEFKKPFSLYTAHDYWVFCAMNDHMFLGKKVCQGKSPMCMVCSIARHRPPQFWRYCNKSSMVLNNISTIITPSQYMANIFSFYKTTKNISIIPNFVIQNNCSSEIDDSNFFLFVGLLEPHKGAFDLVKTYCKILAKTSKNLILIGDGSDKKYIQNYINNHNAQDRIILKGWLNQNEIKPYYCKARAVIIPSKGNENNPLVALESLSCGTPIITSNVGGLPEITSNLNEKLIFNDYKELIDIILNIDQIQLNKGRILDIFENNYSINNYFIKYFSLIDNDQ